MAIPVVNKFAAAMMERLSANKHKAGWAGMGASALLKRLYQEAAELTVAVHEHPEDRELIRKEAADVANFAMFIADNLGDLQS